jgi:hypothetical protein
MKKHWLEIENLRKAIDPSRIRSKHALDNQPLETIIGQKRAMKALDFGIGNKTFGFNIYVSGVPGKGRSTAVRKFIRKKSNEQDSPSDWCYVNNFKNAYYPKAMRLPAGRTSFFSDNVQNYIQDVKQTLNKAFEEVEYLNKKKTLLSQLSKRKLNSYSLYKR